MIRRTIDGSVLTDAQVLDRVHADGAVVILRGTVEESDDRQWSAALVLRAQVCGIQLVVHYIGRVVLVLDWNCVTLDCEADEHSASDSDGQLVGRSANAASADREASRRAHPSYSPPLLRLIEGGSHTLVE
jgi:hypothetical protein